MYTIISFLIGSPMHINISAELTTTVKQFILIMAA